MWQTYTDSLRIHMSGHYALELIFTLELQSVSSKHPP